MRRREFIFLIGALAAAGSFSAHAQQPAVPVVGMLNGQSAEGFSHLAEALRLGLKDEGFVDGQNVTIEYRWAAGRDEQLPAMAVAGRILKGEKVSDLPVVQSTRFEFVINLKTAKTLGMTIPHNLLVAADEVIE